MLTYLSIQPSIFLLWFQCYFSLSYSFLCICWLSLVYLQGCWLFPLHLLSPESLISLLALPFFNFFCSFFSSKPHTRTSLFPIHSYVWVFVCICICLCLYASVYTYFLVYASVFLPLFLYLYCVCIHSWTYCMFVKMPRKFSEFFKYVALWYSFILSVD